MRTRQNGGVIGAVNSPTITNAPGVWSVSEISQVETQPSTVYKSTERYNTPIAWPDGNVTANTDPFYNTTILNIPDLDYTDWVHKDQSNNAWHEYMAADQTYRMPLVANFGPAYIDWSTHFHESGYYTVTDTTGLQFGSGNFTIEFWAKLQRQDGANHWIMGRNNTANVTVGTGWGVYVNTSYQVVFFNAVANAIITSSTVLSRDVWHHVAITRANTGASGTQIWINGAVAGSGTVSSAFTDSRNLIIGRDGVATAAGFFGGKLSDIRISNTAIYSSSFTVPSANLVSNPATTLYSHSTRKFNHDTMPNVQPQFKTVTVTGVCARVIDSPYLNNATMPTGPGYNSMYGYSSSGGFKIYDTNPNNTRLRFGTGNFTVEAWVYAASQGVGGGTTGILGKGTLNVNTASGTGWNLYLNAGSIVWNDSATTLLTSTVTFTFSACGWHHVAAVRSGTGTNQFSLYVDGFPVYTGTLATNYTQTDPLRIFNTRNADYYFRGYLAGIRISNTAIYTSSFTADQSLIPTAMSAFTANTNLLMGASASGDIIHSAKLAWIDRGTARLPLNFRNTEPRIGPHHPNPRGGSASDRHGIYFTGSNNDSLVATTALSDWNFSTGDFSIEVWVMSKYQPDINNYKYILDSRRYFNDAGIAIRWGTNACGIEVYTGNQVVLTSSKFNLEPKTWTHLVVQRVSGSMALYVNGMKISETVYTGAITSTDNRMVIGNSVYPNLQYGNCFNGWMSDLRILKGSAAYARNTLNPDYISVPTAPVPVITNTVLSAFNNASLKDISGRGNYIGWNVAQYTSSNWDFYTCNMSPYNPPPMNRNLAIIGDSWDNNGTYYQGDGPIVTDSQRPEFSFITRMSKAWTIEGFYYWHQSTTTANVAYTYFLTATTTGHEGINLRLGYGNGVGSYNNVSLAFYTAHNSTVQYFNSAEVATATTLRSHTWNHVAIQYDPAKTNKMAMFVNGTRTATRAAFTAGQKIWNTYQAQSQAVGVAGFRISDTARYDNDATTYTVPTQNYTYDQYTYFMPEHGRSTPWFDYASVAGMYTYGMAYPSTEYKKFGRGSLRFNNRDTATIVDRMVFGYSYWGFRPFDQEKQDWTVEFWASWWDAASGGVAFGASGNTVFHYQASIQIKVSSTGFWQLIRGDGTNTYQTLTTTVQAATRSAGTWDHVCCVRRGGSYFFYVNGVERGNIFGNGTGTYANVSVGPTVEINDNFYDVTDVRIGTDYQSSANAWNGYIQDLRWSSMARYTTKVINGVATMVNITTLTPALPTALLPSR